MKTESVDELSNMLGIIAMFKDLLPIHLRGQVNALGLYVQGVIHEEGQPGQWWRLQAGGQLRSYFEAQAQKQEGWQIRKFDEVTWQRRFAHVIEPTYEIAEFLYDRVATLGELDSEGTSVLTETIQQFKATGKWLGLPTVAENTKSRFSSLADIYGWKR